MCHPVAKKSAGPKKATISAGTVTAEPGGTAPRTDLVLLAGHYGRRWFAVAAGYGRAWLTYIENANARDSWYAGTGGRLHAGGKGGVALGALEVVLRVANYRF